MEGAEEIKKQYYIGPVDKRTKSPDFQSGNRRFESGRGHQLAPLVKMA